MLQADLIVAGAGPAGMAAAARAARAGLSVLVLDEQPRAGGQIYRDVERALPRRGRILGKDYAEGLPLVQGMDHSGITHVRGAVLWQIEDGLRISFTVNGGARQAVGRRLLIATGALERPMPLPGWTLPGVMTAGAGQILLKQSGLVGTRSVLVGCGPLLYLIGAQMVRAGTPPLALVETQGRGDLLAAMRHLGGALRGWRYLLKGLGLLAELRRARVPRYVAAEDIEITGENRADSVRLRAGGQQHEIPCDTVFLHHGVVPNTQAARSLEIAHHWDAGQRAFVPQRDGWGRSPRADVFVAGDGAGIGGAKAAALAGELAALEIACDLNALSPGDRDLEARGLRRLLSRELAARPFIDRAYPPHKPALAPADATIICRCEEVTAGDIRRYATMGCLGPNQAKAFGRAGMGPCQGRYCGLSVTEILSAAHDQSQDDTGYYRIRPPLKPVTLAEIAAMDDQRDAAE